MAREEKAFRAYRDQLKSTFGLGERAIGEGYLRAHDSKLFPEPRTVPPLTPISNEHTMIAATIGPGTATCDVLSVALEDMCDDWDRVLDTMSANRVAASLSFIGRMIALNRHNLEDELSHGIFLAAMWLTRYGEGGAERMSFLRKGGTSAHVRLLEVPGTKRFTWEVELTSWNIEVEQSDSGLCS